jgi:Tol biopolymer transport system component
MVATSLTVPNRGGKFDIWVQQVSGSDPVRVTKGLGHNWQPDSSADGEYTAHRSEEAMGAKADFNYYIYKYI